MPASLPPLHLRVLVPGLALGVVLLWMGGPAIPSPTVDRVVLAVEAEAGELDRTIEDALLLREAARRGLPIADSAATLGHMRRVAATRWLPPPADTPELIAFVELRRERFAELLPPGPLPTADDPAWTDDATLAALLRQGAADARAGDRFASLDQYLREIAPRYRVTLTRTQRQRLGGTSGASSSAPLAGPDPAAAASTPGEAPPEAPWPTSLTGPHPPMAALLLEEAAPGLFDLTLLLPPGVPAAAVVPELPEGCTPLGPVQSHPVLPESPGWEVVRDRWACSPPIPGTLPAPTGPVAVDVELRRLDGAAFSVLLEPGAPGAVVPAPGTIPTGVIGRTLLRNAASIASQPAVWILAPALALAGVGATPALFGVVAFGAGAVVGGWLTGLEGSLVPPELPWGMALIAAVLLALTAASVLATHARPHPTTAPPLPLGGRGISIPLGLLGVLVGAASPFLLAPLGGAPGGVWLGPGGWLPPGGGRLPSGDLLLAGAGGLGAILGAVPFLGVGYAAGVLLPHGAPRRILAEALGVAGLALLLPLAWWAGMLFPPALPSGAIEGAALLALTGLLLPLAGVSTGNAWLPSATLLLLTGLALPTGLLPMEWTATLAAGAIVASAGVLVGLGWRERIATPVQALALSGAAILLAGVHLRSAIGPAGGVAWSDAAGAALVALALGWAAHAAGRATPRGLRGRVALLAGVAGLVLALALRMVVYAGPLLETVRTEIAFGRVPLPVPTLLLLIAALLLRPRRRRVAEALGVRPRSSHRHLWALAGAFLLLPSGHLHLPNPLGLGIVPEEEDARRIVTRLLSDTYHAFNLEDEGLLYDRLSETVTPGLLPVIFLDSRRRVAGGASEGDEIEILEVAVLPGGAATPLGDGEGFRWSGAWQVGARITHLTHVHRRENLYTGAVTVRRDGSEWKLDAVELTREERAAMPWGGP